MSSSINKQFNEVRTHLRLHISEWTNVFEVSRKTILEWITGESKPSEVHAARIQALMELITASFDDPAEDFIARTYLIQEIDILGEAPIDSFKGPIEHMVNNRTLEQTLNMVSKRSMEQYRRTTRLDNESEYAEWNLDYNLRRILD